MSYEKLNNIRYLPSDANIIDAQLEYYSHYLYIYLYYYNFLIVYDIII